MDDIEEIHRLLDELETIEVELDSETRDAVDAEEVPRLCTIVNEVIGWDTVYGTNAPQLLGISAPLLTKFAKMRGTVRVRDARIVADRLRNYLRSLDQRTSKEMIVPPTLVEPQPIQPISFEADRWTVIPASSEIQMKITAVATILDSIIEQTKRSNYPSDQQILTEIERKQLIVVLETALLMLKSPLAEKGLLKKAGEGLGRAAASAAQKGVQQGVGKLAEVGAEKIAELLRSLF
jgi:hypothetical protein